MASDLSCSRGEYRPRLGRGVFTRSFVLRSWGSSISSIGGSGGVESDSYL